MPVLPAPSATLSVHDIRFINEYFTNGGNGTRAYMTVHPAVKYTSAEVCAHRLLSKDKIKEELARRTRYESGITKDFLSARLLEYETWAHSKHDYLAGASICMDAAKLAGLITEKREVSTLSSEQSSAIASLVSRTFAHPRYSHPVSTPSSIPSLPSEVNPASVPASLPVTLSPASESATSETPHPTAQG